MRLIDADALNRKKKYSFQTVGLPFPKNEWFIKLADVFAAPTIDAVPVLRCEKCKYWQDNNGGYPHDECRWGKDETPDADDFCSYGERKGGDG